MVAIRSLFEPEVRERIPWHSYATSGLVHSIAAVALIAVSVPAIHLVKPTAPRAVQISSDIPFYRARTDRPKITSPKIIEPPRPEARDPVPPLLRVPEPVVRVPVTAKPVPVPPKIEIAAAPPKPAIPEVDNKPPRPQVLTNTFASAEVSHHLATPKELKMGAFGDPDGVRPNVQATAGIQMARIGSFDASPPAGASHTAAPSRSFVSGAFTSAGASGSVKSNSNEKVQTGQFGDSKPSQSRSPVTAAAPAQSSLTPVEILFKPKPAYTVEARNLKIEGQVALEVVFLSNGEVRIVRVIHGLGHGLDEAAQEAAQHVRFRPAMRAGIPVDTNATIYITFELT